MSDVMERELERLFEASRAEHDPFLVARMAARASDAVSEPRGVIPARFTAWLGALAVCGFALVLLAPVDPRSAPGEQEADFAEVETALGTYLDVGWSDDSLWGDALGERTGELTEQALQEEFAALIDDMAL